jgi:ABC-type bacteriocin/lantibiotic exporter with double-glycine peptidase domain
MKTFFATLQKTNMRYRWVMVLYILATSAAAVGLVVSNRLSGEMSEAALLGDMAALLWLVVWITGVMALRAGASAAAAWLLARFSAGSAYGLRGYFVRHFLRVPFTHIEAVPSGERLSVYSNDIPKAEQLIAGGLFELAADFISFVSAFVFLLIISPRFTGIAFIAAVGMLIVQITLALPLQRWGVKMSEKQGAFNAVVVDSLQNLSAVASYNLEEYMENRYMEVYRQFYAAMKKFALSLAVMAGTMMAIFLSPLIVIFTVLALAVIGGTLTLAEFVAFVTTVTVAAGAVMQLAQNVGRLAEAAAGAKRLADNTNAPEENLTIPAFPNQNPAEIVFSNVSFVYPAAENEPAKPVLDDISFIIKAGSRVALVGASGSGKSTIIKLLLGLYEPTAGTITLNGQDSTAFSKAVLRDAFAYVPQDSFLFPESIGANIAQSFGGDGIPTDTSKLEKACTDAGIFAFIQSLPEGFDAVLTEAADNVSGGQRQRIAMARAFYKDAPVILFDEATASLDTATEAGILQTLSCAAANKTVIMAAHRPQAIAACDTVIMLENGRIAGITREINGGAV